MAQALAMNEFHLQMLSSPRWAKMLEEELLPWIDRVAALGDDVLEIGPGPGLTTDLLRRRVRHLTAIELDDDLCAKLAERFAGTNVTVVHGNGSHSGLPTDRFSSVCCFGVLHHVPSPPEQDALFSEIFRVLRPGGWFLASDAHVDDEGTRAHHVGDAFVPLPLDTLPERLRAAGFRDPSIDATSYEIRFFARKPIP